MKHFLIKHRLPGTFVELASRFYDPLAESLASMHKRCLKPLLIGINGCQGSGKSTLADYLAMTFNQSYDLKAIAISIDDFYLTRSERSGLANTVHPLLQTRGVPGTHDIDLMRTTLKELTSKSTLVRVPRFDKARDDRADMAHWHQIGAPLDIILLEGWCVGIPSQSDSELLAPLNELESHEDTDGRWRRWVNQQLRIYYEPFNKAFDSLIMLKAPGFDAVYRWRLEQEQKLAERQRLANDAEDDQSAQGIMSPEQIARFIQHYQRLTEHALRVIPDTADVCFELDDSRRIIALTTKRASGL